MSFGELRRHILLPLVLTAVFFTVALSPITLLGCFYRGLLAFVIALTSGILSISAAVRAIKGRVCGEADAAWWLPVICGTTVRQRSRS